MTFDGAWDFMSGRFPSSRKATTSPGGCSGIPGAFRSRIAFRRQFGSRINASICWTRSTARATRRVASSGSGRQTGLWGPSRASVTFGARAKGFDGSGFACFPDHRRVSRENVLRARRRIRGLQKQFDEGQVGLAVIRQRLSGRIGHAQQADSWGLRRALLRGLRLRPGVRPL